MPDGSVKDVAVYRHFNAMTPSISGEYDKMREAYEVTGAAKNVTFGDANCILCDAKGLFDVTGRVLKKEKNCLLDRDEIPREWWETDGVF